MCYVIECIFSSENKKTSKKINIHKTVVKLSLQGWDSPRFKLFHLTPWLTLFQGNTRRENCDSRAWWISAQFSSSWMTYQQLDLPNSNLETGLWDFFAKKLFFSSKTFLMFLFPVVPQIELANRWVIATLWILEII